MWRLNQRLDMHNFREQVGAEALSRYFRAVWDEAVEPICEAKILTSVEDFVRSHTDPQYPAREWRINGNLGFGGKVRTDTYDLRCRVDCYPEDENAERDAVIKKANKKLDEIYNAIVAPVLATTC